MKRHHTILRNSDSLIMILYIHCIYLKCFLSANWKGTVASSDLHALSCRKTSMLSESAMGKNQYIVYAQQCVCCTVLV